MTMLTFTIGEVAELLNITTQAIRHYHKIGLLEDPLRDVNNYRCYTLDQIERLQSILHLKRIGLSLKQIDLILRSDGSSRLMRTVLLEQEQSIKQEMMRLQQQLDSIQEQLALSAPLSTEPPNTDIATTSVLADSMRPISSGLTDIVLAVEGDIFNKIDAFPRMEGYDIYIHRIGKQLAQGLIQHERLFIFWMERYLALREMDKDDLQGEAWLNDLDMNTARKVLASTLQLPILPEYSSNHQQYLQKLFVALMLEDGSDLQKQFLTVLATSN